ncbi:MAG: hypothetical protein SGI72_14655 [Planctomycetota bacterium]|nr:hypothetical protein [Planctomycetota bacterium]
MQDRVKGPAIALIIVGALGGALQLFGLVASASMASIYRTMGLPEEQLQRLEGAGSLIVTIVMGALGLAGSAFIIFGGLQMMKLRGWPIALIAAILAMIPCFSSCACFLGIPAGIWAIVVLANHQVKAAFQSNSNTPMS